MLRIEWCKDIHEIDKLAAFFAKNVTRSYISHSELQFGRAEAPDQWFSNLQEILKGEIEERVPFVTPAQSPGRVASAYQGDILVGIAYVIFNSQVPIPFIVVEDIVVERTMRGSGIGQAMIDWIFSRAREENVRRAFLESGKDNHDAHHFFERNGFKQVSIVMMADLPPG
jgi:GNAT superfamily N-acetyltransferase